jgi:hypothetical protein
MTLNRLIVTTIVVVVLGVVSLQRPTGLWAGVAWTLASASLLAAVIRARVCRGEARAWWIGFAVVGGTYFVITFNHPPLEYVEGCLPTTRALDEIYLAVHPEPIARSPRVIVDAWDPQTHKLAQQDGSTYFNINQIHFRWAWHSLLVVSLGLLGGATAVQLSRTRNRTAPAWLRGRSILTLVTAILVSGIVFATLRIPSGATVNVTFGILVASLMWAGLEACVSRGRRRAFWAGYLLFGWAYLLAAFGQFDVRLLVYANVPAEGYLPTSRVLGELFPLVHRAPASGMTEAWNPSFHRPTKLAPPYLYDLNRYFFIQVGHAISGILAGIVGGSIATIPAASAESVDILAGPSPMAPG